VMLQASIEDRALIDARLVRSVLRDLNADLPAATAPLAEVVPEPAAVEAVPAAPVEDERGRRFVPRTARWLDFTPVQDDAPLDDGKAEADHAPAPEPPAPETVAEVHDDTDAEP
ncbi:hypothetical protein ACTGZS_12270, partial [Streptococcus suis]